MSVNTTKPIWKDARGLRFAIVASLYNPEYVDGMLLAAEEVLTKSHAKSVKILRVPGAFEIPSVIMQLADTGKYDGIIALGVIIDGETAHADHLGHTITEGLLRISIKTGVPIIHEVLQVRNKTQAEERCLSLDNNRGAEAAHTSISMAMLFRDEGFKKPERLSLQDLPVRP
ncbi:MAG: 6,7-dimethyl-8-ribityllumazine synthase [Verrucomicrobiota bacterium]|nr:6,7-dimethyl-8-ribityllumazine synthase [Verrucomicrobiota bacterium]